MNDIEEVLKVDTNTLASNELESMDYFGPKDVQTVDIKNSRIRHLFHRRKKNDNCGYCVDIYGFNREPNPYYTIGEMYSKPSVSNKQIRDLK